MIPELHTYNALRATVGPCDAYRMATMAHQAMYATAERTALQHQARQAARAMPITLDGPHYGRKHQRRKALLRAARTACIAAMVVVGLPTVATIAYALAYY